VQITQKILSLIAVLLMAAGTAVGDDASDYIYTGDARHFKGDLGEGFVDYTKGIQLYPDDALTYTLSGLVKAARGDLDGALADYNKSIELNPKFAGAYHSRGCLRYDAQKFPDALIDFRKEDELDASLDYGHFRVWLIRARLGEKEAATKELQAYLDNRKTGKPDDWAAQIARFLAGELAEPEFLKAAENADRTKEAGQLCEAWFYAGTKYLIDGDKAKAAEYFDKCVATGESGFYEYRSAAAELKAMKAGK